MTINIILQVAVCQIYKSNHIYLSCQFETQTLKINDHEKFNY